MADDPTQHRVTPADAVVELRSTHKVDFSGPSREEWDAFFAWAETKAGRTFIQALRDGKTDFRSKNPEEWT